MRIGYRRGSGKLPLSAEERGARGTWLEKRQGLLNLLSGNGHEMLYFSNPTQISVQQGFTKSVEKECDLLMIEFSGLNMTFFGKDWQETAEIAQSHKGPIIFLCDDPDLPFPWKMLTNENWSRWTIAVNAVRLDNAKIILRAPSKVKMFDFPFHAVMQMREASNFIYPNSVYYGRPNGRKKELLPYIGTGQLTIAGNAKEWANITDVTPAPEQKDRADFYAQYKTSFAAFDNKHAQSGWRTGRAYHSLAAGTPVLAPYGNPAFTWTQQLRNPLELTEALRMTSNERKNLHHQQLTESHVNPQTVIDQLLA